MTTDQTITNESAEPASTAENSFTIPEEYADRGWTEKVKSNDDVWKLLDNSQQLIGKRPAGIPDPNAPDEEWEKFYNVFRPESPEKYELGDVENLPEGMDITPYKQTAMEMFHDAGLNQKQAEKLWKSYVGSEMEAVKGAQEQTAEQNAALDKQYDEMANKLFGDQYDAVSTGAQEFIKAALPDELKPVVEQLSANPSHLIAMIKVADHAQKEIADIKKKYGAEDSLASGQQTSGMSKEEIVKKLTEANFKAKSSDPFSQDRKIASEDAEKYRKMLIAISK